MEASGKDVYALKRKTLQQELALLNQESEEERKTYADKLSEIRVLDAQHQVKLAADREAARKKAEEKEKERLRKLKEASDRARAQLEEDQQYELSLAQIRKQDTLKLQIQQAEEKLGLNKQASVEERSQFEKDKNALFLLQEEFNQREKELEDNARQAHREAHQDDIGAQREGQNKINKAVEDGFAETEKKVKDLPDLGADVLTKFFGVAPDKVAAVKYAVTQIAGEIYGSLQYLAQAYLSGAQEQVERDLEAAQTRFDEVSSKLDAAKSKREANENALQSATGAKREYLIAQINKERAAEQRLAAEKKQAASEQAKQEKEKHRLEKISRELQAATTLGTATATAVSATYAAVKAIEKCSEVPFPANIVAIGTGLAAVISAVAAAKSLRSAMKYRDGVTGLTSAGVLIGPSHEGGGVQLWCRTGVHYGEAEGGEAITPTDATRRNAGALELIRTQGRTRTLTPADFATIANSHRILPPPAPGMNGRYADGRIATPTGVLLLLVRLLAVKVSPPYGRKCRRQMLC